MDWINKVMNHEITIGDVGVVLAVYYLVVERVVKRYYGRNS